MVPAMAAPANARNIDAGGAINDGKASIYADGVYDLPHPGHFRSFKSARAFGASLTVGVNSDESVLAEKGWLPVMPAKERFALVAACRWVDRVIADAPYTVSVDFLDNVANCQFSTHGSDLATTVTGANAYSEPIKAERHLTFTRTPQVSTTALITRLAQAARSRNLHASDDAPATTLPVSCFCNIEMIKDFLDERPSPAKGSRIVYTAGCFESLRAEQVDFLKACRAMGDHLIVGLYSDRYVRALSTEVSPVLGMVQRAMSLLALRPVDDVVFDAPLYPRAEYFDFYNISIWCIPESFENVPDGLANFQQLTRTHVQSIADGDTTIADDSQFSNVDSGIPQGPNSTMTTLETPSSQRPEIATSASAGRTERLRIRFLKCETVNNLSSLLRLVVKHLENRGADSKRRLEKCEKLF